MTPASASRGAWLRRVGWFALLWAMSVIALALVAGVLRIAMTAAGLTL
jgi:hypothetical protein